MCEKVCAESAKFHSPGWSLRNPGGYAHAHPISTLKGCHIGVSPTIVITNRRPYPYRNYIN
ncbi:MAG: hypothetical protein HUK12_09900 [Muribaculaceae bacterium]|nr:hypothetical protein [Muribaculaceae bacterium]